ncbi:hypothetical protein [Lujinxingia sediminis]|nr:hypothetical protein [Lujinxingia sediminis]
MTASHLVRRPYLKALLSLRAGDGTRWRRHALVCAPRPLLRS